jgi:iron complex transport system permease protein
MSQAPGLPRAAPEASGRERQGEPFRRSSERCASRDAPWPWMLAGTGAVVAAALAGMALGPAGIAPATIGSDLLARLPWLGLGEPLTRLDATVLWELRAPRVVLGALVGAMLAVAGGGYQAVFRNPLADPYLLGVAAGAGLGATAAIAYLGASSGWLPIAAFGGAVSAVAAAYLLGRSVTGGRDTTTLILAGVAVAAFLSAVQAFVLQQNSQSVRPVYAWLLGRLSTSGWSEVTLIAPYVVVSMVVLLAHRRVLDVLRVGDDEAASLGVEVTRTRLVVVVVATLGTAAAVSASGLIGFVGVVIPHAVRLVAGSSYRLVMPLSMLFGASFLCLADVLARTALSPAELPIGVVTACVGAPFFAVVLRRARGSDT